MIHTGEVLQLSTECLTNCLVTQTNAKDGLGCSKLFDERNQQSRFLWNARPWRKNDFIIGFHFFKRDLVIATNHYFFMSDLLNQVNQIVRKRIVVIKYQYSHLIYFAP